ncbi:hypothetical protein K4K61_011477 [Colletotrichum sp. SAR11_59]|nr:hypothetical protein K4K61_011477 [Colletotrichum sp. SAR11_59]
MTTALPLDHVALRSGTPAEVAQYLRGVRASTADPAPITTQLHDAVVQGSIPHAVFALWTPLHRDARSTAAGLQQSESLLERKTVIKAFVKATRSAVTMDEIWNVAGGTPGIVALMSNLSTDEIKLLCNGLAKTVSLCGSRPERHARLTELVELLLSQENPDPRPLQMCYKRILPACTTTKVAEHEESRLSWSQRQQAILLRAHSALYETRFLDTLLSAETDDVDFNAWKQLVNNNPGFAKDVLSKVLKADGPLPMKADDFVKLAEDITKPLHRRRSSTEKTLAFEILEDLIAIFEKHSDLTKYLNVEPNGVLLNVVKFWEHARSTRPRIQRHLVKLIGLVHESYFKSAKNVTDMVRYIHPAVSYRLFRLTVQSSAYHSFDIEEDADGSKASFKKLKGPWPADLFTAFADDDADASLRLFRKLISTFPESQFLICSSLYRCSIVESAREPETDKGDPYILEAFLVHASSREATSSGSNTSNLVKQRLQDCKDKAARARDWVFRQGWATIALNLSVATGSFDVFADTIVWARRFNKDSNAVKQLYSYNNFPTIEATDLLSGIPSFPFRLENPKTGIKQSVESGNRILMQLLETAVMALREPSFQQYDWSCITSFPEKVIERRLVRANKLERAPHSLSDDEVFDFLWKPTIEFLIEAEKYLLQPNMDRLYPREIKGLIHSIDFDFANNLRPHSARFLDTLAQERDKFFPSKDIVRFPAMFLDQDWLDNVGSYDFEVYDGSTDLVMFAPVSLVAQVAQSVLQDVEEKESFHPNAVKPMDLAMRLKIVLGRPDDSAWHRQLLNKGLFSKLSPTDTKAFLLSVADGILDKLDQQDVRNKEQAEQDTGGSDRKLPLVKVTTVKMLAKLLSDSPFLDPKTSLTILSHLMDKARHIDIRVAIIESLYDALGSSAASDVKDEILILLEKHALPLAAGFNERGPAWASWEEVEAGEPLPTVSAISGDNVVRQIFATWDYRLTDDLDLKKKMAALSLRVIEESAKNHRQWLELFVKKHNLTLSTEEKLFNTPLDTGMLALFGRNPEFLTHSIFGMIKDSYVTVELLQQFAREVFDSLVRSGDVDVLEEFFRSMTPMENNEDNVESLARWKLITLPMLEEVIAKIAKLRTLEWQKDIRREPARLPDTFRLKSALVVFPVNDDEEEIFIKDVMRLIEELAPLKGPYHKKWEYFKTKSMKPCRDRRRRMFHLAIRLGSLNGVDLDSPSLPDQLRVELAAFLLDKGHPFVAKDPDVVAGLKAMLHEWAESPIEEFRTSAMKIVDGFKKAGNDDWFTRGGGLDWVKIETDNSDSEEDVD